MQIPIDEYHNPVSRWLTRSALEVFRESPRLYHARYVSQTIEPKPSTPAQQLGTLIHLAVLETERFCDHVRVAPDVDRRTKAGKAEHAAFLETVCDEDIVATEAQYAIALGCREAVHASPVARELIEAPGECESTIRWSDAELGTPRQARPDKLCPGLDVVLELKSALDPSPAGFARAAARYGYHRQDAWLLDAAAAQSGSLWRCAFVAVRPEPPHEVGVYELDSRALEVGAQQIRSAMLELDECRRTGQWAAGWEREALTLTLPGWLDADDQYRA